MTSFDIDDLKTCEFQGNLFEKSTFVLNCSSPVFIRRFMNSETAKRMDKGFFMNGSNSIESVLDEITEEYGPTDYGTTKYSSEEMYWIGYLTRYWVITRNTSSSQIYKIVKPKELRSLFYPYHSLDPDQAIDRILESKNLLNVDQFQRDLDMMRKINKDEMEQLRRKLRINKSRNLAINHGYSHHPSALKK